MHTPAGGVSAAGSRSSPDPGASRSDDAGAAVAGRETQARSEAKAAASLAGLEEAVQQVSTGLSAALEVNARLAAELADVRALLESSQAERTRFEQKLQEVQSDAERRREFLIAEQDSFLAGLLEEHEQAIADLERQRDEAVAAAARAGVADSRPPSAQRTAPGLGELRPLDALDAPTVRPANRTNPGLGDTAPPTGVTPPIDASIESLDKLLAERERSRDVLKRLQSQRDEAQQALADVTRDRDDLLRELDKLAPGRFSARKRPWSPHSARLTQPAIPNNMAGRVTEPAIANGWSDDDSAGDRVTAPPSDDALAAIDASRPSPSKGTPKPAEDPGIGVDGRPLLKRKPDPAARPLGGYSISGDEVEDSDEPKARRKRR